uniref:Putative secreted protein n=1 Tax=Anopheles darlingi TaxID=43151 RepID=A0A2M4D305_ANODA
MAWREGVFAVFGLSGRWSVGRSDHLRSLTLRYFVFVNSCKSGTTPRARSCCCRTQRNWPKVEVEVEV